MAPNADTAMSDGPHRRCIVTGEIRPKSELLRFVRDPGGTVVVDPDERLPGRGLWLSACRDVVNTASTGGLLAKAARAPVHVPADLADRVDGLLQRRCLDLIGLARRAGQAVAGFEKVKARLRAGRVGVLVTAADGASGGRAKLLGGTSAVPEIGVFDGDQLGAVVGRDRAVYVAVEAGGLADALRRTASRLAAYRGIGPDGGGTVGDDSGGPPAQRSPSA